MQQDRSTGIWRHGPVVFDTAAMRLTVNGIPADIEPRALNLLRLLLDRPGEAVSKTVIMDALWPDRFVTEASLTKCVARLRKAIGDESHNLIRTVHGFGYRLDLPAQDDNPQAAPAVAAASVTPKRPRALIPGLAAAACVALALAGWRLAAAPGAPPHHHPPAAAQALYLQGLQDWSARTAASLDAAQAAFRRVLAIDPRFAEAHAALARTYLLQREFGAMPEGRAYALAKDEAKQALALDPSLATARSALGFVLFWADWDFESGLDALRQAVMLEPGNPSWHHWYATAAGTAGKTDIALAEIDRARELEPGSFAIRTDRGVLLMLAGRNGEAGTLLRALEQEDPKAASPHRFLADLALAEGDDATYLREGLTAALLRGDTPEAAVFQAASDAYAARGHAGFVQALIAARRAAYDAGHGGAAALAVAYALGGARPQALDYFEIAVRRHEAAALEEKDSGPLRPLLGGGLAPIEDRFRVAAEAR